MIWILGGHAATPDVRLRRSALTARETSVLETTMERANEALEKYLNHGYDQACQAEESI